MVREQLIRKSPLRILDRSLHGGLEKGNIGVIAARKGVGKTACLVHIATDQLFQGNHVIHVSFSEKTDHIVSWYEDIFREISKRVSLDNAMEVHDAIVRNRVIMNFNQHHISTDQVLDRIGTMMQNASFKADCITVDGYDFYSGTPCDFEKVKAFAQEQGLRFWFSASLKDNTTAEHNSLLPAVLQNYEGLTTVIIVLDPEEDRIRLKLIKDHDMLPVSYLHLTLDPRTLLISDEDE
jgi:hypothetical protein